MSAGDALGASPVRIRAILWLAIVGGISSLAVGILHEATHCLAAELLGFECTGISASRAYLDLGPAPAVWQGTLVSGLPTVIQILVFLAIVALFRRSALANHSSLRLVLGCVAWFAASGAFFYLAINPLLAGHVDVDGDWTNITLITLRGSWPARIALSLIGAVGYFLSATWLLGAIGNAIPSRSVYWAIYWGPTLAHGLVSLLSPDRSLPFGMLSVLIVYAGPVIALGLRDSSSSALRSAFTRRA